MAGEFDLIDWIRAAQGSLSQVVEIGIGDDLAALKWAAEDLLLVGVDQVIDGVHFNAAAHTPHQIGRKAMNRNLSDCAAMGCLPSAALVAVVLPRDFSIDRARQLYRGIREAGDAYECPVVGGDTATWDGKLVVTVTILGRSAGQKPVTRSGAKPGDHLFVTGPLGGSILGRHLTFEPRVALGRKLGPQVSAMIDLSDGLSRDLSHICRASAVGAVVESALVPIHADAQELSKRDKVAAIDHALDDGEDYELLFTSAAAKVEGAIRIGQITPDPKIVLRDADGELKPLKPRGWQHALKPGE